MDGKQIIGMKGTWVLLGLLTLPLQVAAQQHPPERGPKTSQQSLQQRSPAGSQPHAQNSAQQSKGFHQTGAHQAMTMRRLMAPHSYGVLVVAQGRQPNFAALASKTTKAHCLAQHAIRVDGVTLASAPQFLLRQHSLGLCEQWLSNPSDVRFFASRLENDHFIQINGHDINVKNYHLDWLHISGHKQ
ncbi:MAG: hypothetical protein ACRC8Q_04935 [Aeromonas sp.]